MKLARWIWRRLLMCWGGVLNRHTAQSHSRRYGLLLPMEHDGNDERCVILHAICSMLHMVSRRLQAWRPFSAPACL